MSERSSCVEPEVGNRLAAYELGLLPPGERAAVEAHLVACEACREEAWSSAPYAAVLSGDPGGVRAAMGPRAAGTRGRERATAGRRVVDRLLAGLRAVGRWFVGPRALAPAAALAALAIVLTLRGGGPGDLASLARVEPLPWVPMTTRDAAADDATSLFRRGMTEYAAHEWRTAAATLRRALEAEGADDTWPERERAHLFLGLCFLLDRDASAAIAPLSVATGSPLPVIADRARWYLAQAELMRANAAAAEAALRELADDSPGYGKVAAEQLRQVRALGER